MPHNLITTSEAAKIAGVCVSTIKNWCEAKRIKGGYKIGVAWIIPRAALREAAKKKNRPRRGPKSRH